MEPAAPLSRSPSNRRLIVYLVLLAAFLPEAITGATPPLAWLNPFQVGLLLWLYGSGVLLCREVAIRWRAGWPGIVLLGAAYGIVEEGLAVKTFFDPTLSMLGPLGWYGRLAGVNWVWSLWLTIFHAAFSIAFPIFLVEWRWPSLRGRPLLSPMAIYVPLGLLASAAIFDHLVLTPYRPGIPELAGAIAVIGFLAWGARGWAGRLWARLPSGPVPSRRLYVATGFLFFGLSFLVYGGGPTFGGHPAVTYLEGGLLLAFALLLLRRLSGKTEAEAHGFAFVAGSIGAFVAWTFFLELSGIRGAAGVGIGFAILLVWLFRARANRSVPASAITPSDDLPPPLHPE